MEDESYVEGLLQRLRSGTAGAMEPLLWRYTYGEPRNLPTPTAEDSAKAAEERRYRQAALNRLPQETLKQLVQAYDEVDEELARASSTNPPTGSSWAPSTDRGGPDGLADEDG